MAVAWYWQCARTATCRSKYWRDSQLLSPFLPPCAGESNRKQLYAKAVQQKCADENVSTNMRAFSDASVNVDNTDASTNTCQHVRERTCKLTLSICGRRECYFALSCGHLKDVMSLTADPTDGKTGYRSNGDACRQGWYFSHLQWRASVVTASTMSHRGRGRAT